MSNGKNYTNPEFIEAFQRVKEILIDLKDRIMPVKQGNAVNFRKNINDAIGTIPETNQETGAITKDGYGMSGAVFAMGEAVEKGLDNMDTALVQFTNDANDKFDTFTNEKNTALTNFTNEKTKALNDFKDEKNTALTNFENESDEALNTLQVKVDAKTKEAMEQATADANTAADRANSAAQGITNTFVCLAQSDSGTDSYPVTVDAEGNETEITQSQGAVWFKIVSEVNTSTENTEIV